MFTQNNLVYQELHILCDKLFPLWEREIKFIGLFGYIVHQGPYKPCNHNLYIGIIIFPHIDNPQSTGYN